MGKIKDTIKDLKQRSANMNGDELEKILKTLGFDVRAGNNGKHCVVTHEGLPELLSTSFDKGHGKQMLSVYVNNICRVLQKYEEELDVLNGDGND